MIHITLFISSTLKEKIKSVRGNGKGNPSSHLHGINTNDLTILRVKKKKKCLNTEFVKRCFNSCYKFTGCLYTLF